MNFSRAWLNFNGVLNDSKLAISRLKLRISFMCLPMIKTITSKLLAEKIIKALFGALRLTDITPANLYREPRFRVIL